MAQLIEFIGNHPFLVAAAAALIVLIIAYEVRNATRGFREVDTADATRLINGGAAVLDLRPRADYDAGHVIGAVSTPADTLDALDLKRYQDRALVVYCANGVASARDAAKLAKAGHQRVHLLKGGLAAWESAGLPLSRGRKARK